MCSVHLYLPYLCSLKMLCIIFSIKIKKDQLFVSFVFCFVLFSNFYQFCLLGELIEGRKDWWLSLKGHRVFLGSFFVRKSWKESVIQQSSTKKGSATPLSSGSGQGYHRQVPDCQQKCETNWQKISTKSCYCTKTSTHMYTHKPG